MTFSLTDFQRYLALAGYETRDVPYIERADLFSTKGGDRVIERLLTFSYGNAEYALRPEFTAAAARSYAAAGRSVVRWQFSGAVFEDQTGSGRHAFQRQSVGAELLGLAGPLADSEMIGLAASGLFQQGINGFQVVVGHAGLTRALIERYVSDPQLVQFILGQRGALSDSAYGRPAVEATVRSLLDQRVSGVARSEQMDDTDLSDLLSRVTQQTSTMGGRTRQDVARRLLHKQRRSDELSAVLRAVEALDAWISLRGPVGQVLPQVYQFAEDAPEFAETAADLRTTLDLLEQYDIPGESIVLQPDLNRIWDYYSGVVFELQANGISLGGGGRYDGLLRLLGNPVDAPAVGFQLNVEALWRLAGQDQDLSGTIAVVGGRPHAPLVLQWASRLRAAGLACEVFEEVPVREHATIWIDADGAHIDGRSFGTGDAAQLVQYLNEQDVL